jgi:hypothetical protein
VEIPDTNTFDTETRAQEHVTKAQNFQRMGLAASAEHEMHLAWRFNPAVVADPRYQAWVSWQAEQRARADAWKLPLRVGACLLGADALVCVVLGWLNLAMGGPGAFLISGFMHIAVDLYLVVNLLRLKDTARRGALWLAVIGPIYGAYSAVTTGAWPDLIVQVSLSVSVVVLLLGKPSKLRTILAVTVFIVGYLGILCGAFMLSAAKAIG